MKYFAIRETLEELDLTRYDGKITDLFLGELASCSFIKEKKNLIMISMFFTRLTARSRV